MRRNERGLSLTELTIVGVLATVVMLALTGFYFNSQRTWIDGSTQAVTQREASLLVDELATHIRAANQALVDDADPLHHTLSLFDPDHNSLSQFLWNPSDSTIHEWNAAGNDLGPVVGSKVDRFQLTASDSIVRLDMLEVRTASGDDIRTSSSFALYNRIRK